MLFGNFPDMTLDSSPHIKLNDTIQRALNDIKPDLLFTHNLNDVNSDHRQVFKSAAVAARPVDIRPSKMLLFETPSSTEWSGYDSRQVFVPNVFVDITDTISKKIEAFECYQTEVRAYPHPRSPEGIDTYASFRGLAAGLNKAEAFVMYRCIGLPL